MSKQPGMFRRFLVKEGQKLVDILDGKAEEPIVPSTALPEGFMERLHATCIKELNLNPDAERPWGCYRQNASPQLKK